MRMFKAIVGVSLLAATLGVPAASSMADDSPSTSFHVALNFNGIAGEGWLLGADLTVTVDDPTTTTQTQDYVFTVHTDENGAFQSEGLLPAGYAAGWFITVTDGVHTKDHFVQLLSITDVDPAADIMYGIAAPGEMVVAQAGASDDALQMLFVDARYDGTWKADFGGIYDIQPGDITRALRFDDDGDFTFTDWQVPATLDDLLDDMVADGRLPTTGLATSIAKQALSAPLPALTNHLDSLVRKGVITQETMDQILAFIAA